MFPTFGVLNGMGRDKGPMILQPQMALFYQSLMIDLYEHGFNVSCLGETEMLREIRSSLQLNQSQIPNGLLRG
jgi:hypothetical protein